MADVVEGDRGERGPPDTELEGRGAHEAPALVAGVDDAAVDHVDPADQLVGEAEAVGRSEGFEILDHCRAADRRSG